MIEMTSLFAGILSRSSATVINIGASIWVMDPAVQTVANTIPLPDYVLDEVRSIPGVKYAVPLYSGACAAEAPDGTYPGRQYHRAGRHEPVRPAAADGRKHRRHLCRERLHRRQGLGVLQAREPEDRHRVRAQRPSRRDRRHRARRIERSVRRADPLHDLQPGAAIHSQHALHHVLPAGRAQITRRYRRRSSSGWRPRDIWRSRKRGIRSEDIRLLQVSDRHRNQHAAS